LAQHIAPTGVRGLADYAALSRARMRQSSVDHFLRPAQQLDVELATSEQHVVQRFADIVGL
jgi:hypothetical protein